MGATEQRKGGLQLSLPFQAGPAGIQISILMSESTDGASVAAMRQNSGSVLNGLNAGAPGSRIPAGVPANCPAGTSCARVIVACGSACDARSAQATGTVIVRRAADTGANAASAVAAIRAGSFMLQV